MAIRKSIELNENENTIIGVAKMTFRGKCIALKTYISNDTNFEKSMLEKMKTNDLTIIQHIQ